MTILAVSRKNNTNKERDVYLCFIDNTKAFDKVGNKDLLERLSNLDIFGKDARIIKNLYRHQTTCIRIGNESSRYRKTEKGIRQEFAFSPGLFNL